MAAYEDWKNIAQDPDELRAFTELLVDEGVRSYLEIGSKFGGSLWAVGSALPPGSKIVSVDMPNGTRAWEQSRTSLIDCTARLRLRGQDCRIVWGDSTSRDVVADVRSSGPFDAILIDANHTMPYLKKDWENYSDLGKIIAFHDLSWHRQPEWKGIRIDVPEFWNEIKDNYIHREIRMCPTGKNNGIGILWREQNYQRQSFQPVSE